MDQTSFKSKISTALRITLVFGVISLCFYLWIFASKENTSQAIQRNDQAKITVTDDVIANRISPYIWGANLSGKSTAEHYYQNIVSKENLKAMGISELRFPNGCHADLYNWRNSTLNHKTNNKVVLNTPYLKIDEALKITKDINADLVYVVNIEYNKSISNPCGNINLYPNKSNSENYKILRNDIQEIARKYKGQIKTYELGNEPWGYWNVKDYINLAKDFASVIKKEDPSAIIGIVGYPSTGNNQSEDLKNQNPKYNQWTKEIQKNLNFKCQNKNCFDFITDHPYFIRSVNEDANKIFGGSSGFYAKEVFPKIFQKNKSVYKNKPIGLTEYNIICWNKVYNPEVWGQTVEHSQYLFETLMNSAKHGIYSAHYHVFHPDSPCGATLGKGSNGRLSTVGQVFALTSSVKGGKLLQTNVEVNKAKIPLAQNCIAFNCLRGGGETPYLTSYSAYDTKGNLVVLILNKNQNQLYNTSIDLTNIKGISKLNKVNIETYLATDIKDKEFTKTNKLINTNTLKNISIPSLSITKLTFYHEKIATKSKPLVKPIVKQAIKPSPSPKPIIKPITITPIVKTTSVPTAIPTITSTMIPDKIAVNEFNNIQKIAPIYLSNDIPINNNQIKEDNFFENSISFINFLILFFSTTLVLIFEKFTRNGKLTRKLLNR